LVNVTARIRSGADTVPDQIGDAVRHHAGLAGAGARQHQQGAPGAAEALEAARAAPPDLLLTAFELESLDGLQLARRIRDAGGAAAVIIIAQTAYQRLACELAQTPDSRYLAKPVGEKAFGETVESVLLAARAGDAPTP
jgi:CheY-like chemotaxis protein